MAVSPSGNVHGPSEVKATAMRLGPKGRAVFTVKGWNDAIRRAGEAAIGFWLSELAPKRFNIHYAMRELPYMPGDRKKVRAFRYGEDAFYSTGTLKNNLFMRSTPDVRAKGGGVTSMRLRVPIGHWMSADTLRAFRTVPAKERAAVSSAFRRALIQELQAGRAKAAAKAQAKAERKARAAANKAKRLETKSRMAARRQARASAAASRRSSKIKPSQG